MTVICPACKKEVPDDSAFCLSCGRPLKAEDMDIILPPDGSPTEGRATIYLVLAIMFLFFGSFLLIPGFIIGLIGMIVPSLIAVLVGFVFLGARFAVLRKYQRRVIELRKEAAAKHKCSYCGTLNPESAEKCSSCGATL